MVLGIGGADSGMADHKSRHVSITPTSGPLRILCFGAGAIGTYIGGSLALAGHQVVFLERPTLADQLHKNGLHLTLGDRQFSVDQPRIIQSLDELLSGEETRFDAGLVAVKAYDTAEFAQSLAPYREVLPPLLCLQNGVDNESQLGEVIGVERVISGTVTSAIGRLGVGEIVLERLRGVGVTAGFPISDHLVRALNEAGLSARLYANGASMKWSKLLTNLLANATSAILDMTPAQIYAHPGLVRLEIGQIKEALHVMRRLGLQPVNLPGTPIKLLVWGIDWLPTSLLGPLMRRVIGSGRGGKMPSFHIDLHQGRGISEVRYLNGAVVLHGAENGYDALVNRRLTEILEGLTDRTIALEEYRHAPEKLLAAINDGRNQ